MRLECVVEEVVPLRVPRVFRVKGNCGEVSVEMELHEEAVEIPSKNSKMLITVSTSRDECLNHYFCAHGYVVSNVKLDDIYRVVVSLHGLLVVLKSKKPFEYATMDHLYVGATFLHR